MKEPRQDPVSESHASLWVVHTRDSSTVVQRAADEGLAVAEWIELGDLSLYESQEALRTAMRQAYPNEAPETLALWAGDAMRFVWKMQPGQLVVWPLPKGGDISVGIARGGYEFRSNDAELVRLDAANVRRVDWVTSLPRTAFSRAALASFDVSHTVHEASQHAEEVKRLLAERADRHSADDIVVSAGGQQSYYRAADVFVPGQRYTREQVQQLLGLVVQRGGNWFTGYHKFNGDWFLFPNVGVPGRTGHDYGNRWEGERLRWWGRTGSHVEQPSIQDLLAPEASVHLFHRSVEREPFEYFGPVRAVEVIPTTPVQIVWERAAQTRMELAVVHPSEMAPADGFVEGRAVKISVDARERSAAARAACIRIHGCRCAVCGLSLEERYGGIAAGIIEVHHVSPLAEAEGPRAVDPEKDLRPVCPNCHTVIHLRTPPFSIDEASSLLRGGSVQRVSGPNPQQL